MKIGKYEIKHPIIQGGMGVGISWDKLAGTVSKEGGLGVISAIGTGYYENEKYVNKKVDNRPVSEKEFYSKEALKAIFANARKICGDAPLACNVLYAINDYGRVVTDACEAGANMIITGAGLPTNMPELTFGITVPPCSPFGGLLGIFATYSPYLNRLEVQFFAGMTTPCRLRITSEPPTVFLSPCLP
jgi:NAD(P)H-dependent flavin oxidoreductase YrpB (nitropropane dioxygenase family)